MSITPEPPKRYEIAANEAVGEGRPLRWLRFHIAEKESHMEWLAMSAATTFCITDMASHDPTGSG